MYYLRFVLLLFLPLMLDAQDENIKYQDYIYKNYIKSVRFHLNGLLLSHPIVDLNSSAQLVLNFDDMEGGVRDFVYSIVHCNADWTPSNLTEMDYLEGFAEETIDDYRYSFNTIVNYTHYQLLFPNENMGFKLSGNYLLKVYVDDYEKELVLTRRFMVVDNKVQVQPTRQGAVKVSKLKTHHEFDFKVVDKNEIIANPRNEMQAIVLQNGRWDNAITGLTPIFVRGQEMVFDYQDKIVFPAGREFRYLDLRSLQYRSENVYSIDTYDDGYEVVLQPDRKRSNVPHLTRTDANGQFIIEVRDEVQDHDLRADYADVLFSLKSPLELEDKEVYIFGGLTDWQVKPRYKMVYNDQIKAYVAKVPIKQGFYDYIYAAVDTKTKALDFSETEGSWYETQNEYTFLVYYRPFGGRYDQLISAFSY